MTRIIYQDKAFVVPDVEIDGDELRKKLEVPTGHDLVMVRPEGNFLLNRRRKVLPMENDYFVDAPTFEYGTMPS